MSEQLPMWCILAAFCVVIPCVCAYYVNREGWILKLKPSTRRSATLLCFVPFVGVWLAWILLTCHKYGLEFLGWLLTLLVSMLIPFGPVVWLILWLLKISEVRKRLRKQGG